MIEQPGKGQHTSHTVARSRRVYALGRGRRLLGNIFGLETPGLMVGLAGIGYQLIRLAKSQRVPSVLLLEMPENQTLQGEGTG